MIQAKLNGKIAGNRSDHQMKFENTKLYNLCAKMELIITSQLQEHLRKMVFWKGKNPNKTHPT